jgi:DNA-binding NtrC family response regulator
MTNESVYIIENQRDYADKLVSRMQMAEIDFSLFSSWPEFLSQCNDIPGIVVLPFNVPGATLENALSELIARNRRIKILLLADDSEFSTAHNLKNERIVNVLVRNKYLAVSLVKAIRDIRMMDRLYAENAELKERFAEPYRNKRFFPGQSDVESALNKSVNRMLNHLRPLGIYAPPGLYPEKLAAFLHANGMVSDQPFFVANKSRYGAKSLSGLFEEIRPDYLQQTQSEIPLSKYNISGTFCIPDADRLPQRIQQELTSLISPKTTGYNTNPLNCRFVFFLSQPLAACLKSPKMYPAFGALIGKNYLEIPPISQHLVDLPHYISKVLDELKSEVPFFPDSVSDEAMKILLSYSFPGNLSELRDILTQACRSANQIIQARDIQLPNTAITPEVFARELSLDEYNKYIVSLFLIKYHNDVVLVANKLKIGKSTLYRKLEKWGIDYKRF